MTTCRGNSGAADEAVWAADWLCTDIEVRALRTREFEGPRRSRAGPPPPEDTATDYEATRAACGAAAHLGRGPTLMVRAGAPTGSVHSSPPPASGSQEAECSL
ncbi:hypothetical protein Srufu_047960 [Streptomyces libani subsp. rufus]|nr:hypothetical protein Srufu_047960 [Streptomyces libani subsp. rufus]